MPETLNERRYDRELMMEMTEPGLRRTGRAWRMRQLDFPKLYSLRASEEVCLKTPKQPP